MANLSLSGDPKPKKKKTEVDACSDGACAPKTRAKMSLSKFSTKSRYNLNTSSAKDVPAKTPPGGVHMNVRNLGDEPGETKLSVDNNKTALSSDQEKTGVKLNLKNRKQKKRMSLYLD